MASLPGAQQHRRSSRNRATYLITECPSRVCTPAIGSWMATLVAFFCPVAASLGPEGHVVCIAAECAPQVFRYQSPSGQRKRERETSKKAYVSSFYAIERVCTVFPVLCAFGLYIAHAVLLCMCVFACAALLFPLILPALGIVSGSNPVVRPSNSSPGVSETCKHPRVLEYRMRARWEHRTVGRQASLHR